MAHGHGAEMLGVPTSRKGLLECKYLVQLAEPKAPIKHRNRIMKCSQTPRLDSLTSQKI